MMKHIITLIFMAQIAMATGEFLEVKEISDPFKENNEVCLKVESIAEASNKLVEVVADYFVGLEYESKHIKNNHGVLNGVMSIPCVATPLANAKMTVEVEVTDTLMNEQREYIRVKCADLPDADKKAKKIKAKYFKDKPTKEKIKG